MDDAVPCEASIVDYYVDLAVAKLRRLLDKRIDVGTVQHVARYGDRTAAGLVDRFGYCFCFLCAGGYLLVEFAGWEGTEL